VPQLKELYEELKKRNSPFEIVFISFDKNKEEMASYFTQHHGDWLAVPFGHNLIE
jgi:nucleoredoxin